MHKKIRLCLTWISWQLKSLLIQQYIHTNHTCTSDTTPLWLKNILITLSLLSSNILKKRYLFVYLAYTILFWEFLRSISFHFTQQGLVVRRPISTNPRLNFNLGFFILLFTNALGIIICILLEHAIIIF